LSTYVVLLREMETEARDTIFPLEQVPLSNLATLHGVEISELLVTLGIVHAILVCRAPSNQALIRMLDDLEGWHADALLATRHVLF
jgi:hypothetical protein